ncbi:MAG: RluA family pseudouridine synthase [Mariprofundaceae bacterium]|nr:RluA family pseudouridine synthase [Mariprofundaceae bacterium]
MQLPDDSAGQRLDHVLTRLTDYSRGRIQQLLKNGSIQLNQHPAKASFRVRGGEMVYIPEIITETLNIQPEAIPLDILYEDETLLVVNKPAGMVVHPSCGHDSGTLVHALLHHCPSLPGINGVERPGIVHRLDKDSSGALVVAKTDAAHLGLSDLFARHDIQREYLAWCRGAPPWYHKRIETMIGRHPHHRQKMSVLPEQSTRGRLAITNAGREQVFNHGFSRMRLTLHTGRTHQIRVHLADAQLPILGDTVYARSFNPGQHLPVNLRTALHELARQALHAEVLGFIHPISGESIHCVAPLPCDVKNLDVALRAC